MKRLIRPTAIVLLSVLAACGSAASPRLNLILPRGIQRGAEHVITFHGTNLGDAEEVLFYEPGIDVIKVESSGNEAKATVQVAADCRLGEHVAQIAHPQWLDGLPDTVRRRLASSR